MKIEKKGFWYEYRYVPESLADFKQAVRLLCHSYGCFVTIAGVATSFIIDQAEGGFVIAENVEKKNYWRQSFASLDEMAEKCSHVDGVPLKSLFGRLGIQTICDCA